MLLVRDLLARAEQAANCVEHATDAQDGAREAPGRRARCRPDRAGVEGRGTGLSFARAAGRRGLAMPVILLSEGCRAGLDLGGDRRGCGGLSGQGGARRRAAGAGDPDGARARNGAAHGSTRRAQIDPLTGLPAATPIWTGWSRRWRAPGAAATCAAVMLVDLDRFDAVNQAVRPRRRRSLLLRLIGDRHAAPAARDRHHGPARRPIGSP